MIPLKLLRVWCVGSMGWLVAAGLTPARGQDASAPPASSPVLGMDWFQSLLGRGTNVPAVTPRALEVVTPAEFHQGEARKHQAANRWSAALAETALAIQADPTDFNSYDLRARLFAARELYAHAIATMTDAIAACPDYPIAWGARGSYRCDQRDRAGLADIEQGFRRYHDDDPAELKWLRSTRASAYFRLGDDRRCVEECDLLIAAGQADDSDLTNRALACLRLGDFNQAAVDFERAVALQPTARRIYLRGLARLRAGRFAEAVADLEQASQDFPTHVPTQCHVGLALDAVGRTGEATAHLDRLLAAQPDDGAAQTARGWVALLTGDFAQAHRLLSQAADHPAGRVLLSAEIGNTLWKRHPDDVATAEFEARCRQFPGLRAAFVFRSGDAARTHAIPRADFTATLVCRLLPGLNLAPTVIVHAIARYDDQPRKGPALVGELVASSCLRDLAKLWKSLENYGIWLEDPPTLADSFLQSIASCRRLTNPLE